MAICLSGPDHRDGNYGSAGAQTEPGGRRVKIHTPPTINNTTFREDPDRTTGLEMTGGGAHRSERSTIACHGNRRGTSQHHIEPAVHPPQAVNPENPHRPIDRHAHEDRIELGGMISGHDDRPGRKLRLPDYSQPPTEPGQEPERG